MFRFVYNHCNRLLLLFLVGIGISNNYVVGWTVGTPIDRRNALAGIFAGVSSQGLFSENKAWANDEENLTKTYNLEVDDAEEARRREEVRQRMLERRQLMQASRSTSNRQSYLDLSRQRAALYNTTSRAVSCPPNIPCL